MNAAQLRAGFDNSRRDGQLTVKVPRHWLRKLDSISKLPEYEDRDRSYLVRKALVEKFPELNVVDIEGE